MKSHPNIYLEHSVTLVPERSIFRRQGPTWKLQTLLPCEPVATMRQSTLRMLSVAHSERLDVRPLIEKLALEHRGWYRKQLLRVSQRIGQGTPLVAALEQTPGVLSTDDVLALRFGVQTGTLREIYQDLLDRRTSTANDNQLRQASVYWIVLLGVMFLITAYLTFFILPNFHRIVDDLSMQLPMGLQILNDVKSFFIGYPWIGFLLLGVMVYLLITGMGERWITRASAYWVGHHHDTKTSIVLRLLAVALKSGRPISGALSTLAKYHYSLDVRRRLLVARNELEQGFDPWQGLASTDLILPRESSAIQMLADNLSKAWYLETLAHERESRAESRNRWIHSLVHPTVVLLFGAIVLLIAKTFFGMNLMLIESFS